MKTRRDFLRMSALAGGSLIVPQALSAFETEQDKTKKKTENGYPSDQPHILHTNMIE